MVALWAGARREEALGSDAERLAEVEMQVTEAALGRNPKSYMAWHHRQWVLSRARHCLPLARELQLLERLFQADERNFHAWSHRRFVCGLMGRGADAELRATEERIQRNFSNFSAWHERARLMTEASADPGAAGGLFADGALDAELETTTQAIFTEPDDQSAWVYLHWVVAAVLGRAGEARRRGDGAEAAELEGRVAGVRSSCEELIALDPGGKWASLTLVLVAGALQAGAGEWDGGARAALGRLGEVDPDRRGFYRYLLDAGPAAALRVLPRVSQ